MGAVGIEEVDVSPYGEPVAEKVNVPGSIDDRPAERSFHLMPGEDDGRARVGDPAVQVKEDAAAARHAARRDDDRRSREMVELLGLLARDVDAGGSGSRSVSGDRPAIGLVRVGKAPEEVVHVRRHRAVEVDGHGRDRGILTLEHADRDQEHLGSLDGERRHDDGAASVKCCRERAMECDPRHRVRGLVAVRRLAQDDVGFGELRRVAQERAPVASEVAGEDKAPTADVRFDVARAENVTGIVKADVAPAAEDGISSGTVRTRSIVVRRRGGRRGGDSAGPFAVKTAHREVFLQLGCVLENDLHHAGRRRACSRWARDIRHGRASAGSRRGRDGRA